MLWLALLISSGCMTQLSSADRAMLARLRQSVASLEAQTMSWEQFEGEQPRSRVQQWRRLQRRLPSTRSGSADLAFSLAFYGVDYNRNLHRLLLPYRRWRRSPYRSWSAADRHDEAVAGDLPADLEILYRKHHNDASLGALLDLGRVEGAAETPGQALSHLWNNDPVPLLRLAVDHPGRMGRLAAMLAESSENPVDRRELREALRKLAQHPDARVARAAKRVLRRVPEMTAWPLNSPS